MPYPTMHRPAPMGKRGRSERRPTFANYSQVVGEPQAITPQQPAAPPQPAMQQGVGGGGMDPRMLTLIKLMLMRQGGDVPGFAYGGVVDQPTLATLGERGPEAVVPLGNVPKPFSPGTPEYLTQGVLSSADTQQALGPDYLNRVTRRRAQRTADAQRRRSAVLARLSGLDPMQQRSAMLESDAQANQGLSDTLNASELQGASGYQDWLRQLIGGEYGAARQRKAEQDAANKAFWGQLVGSTIGSAGKIFTGGAGG